MKNILLLFSFVFILSGCKKSIDALPEATQTGANTFGLKLNGTYWVPQKFAGINMPILEAFYGSTGRLLIRAQNFASEPTETEFDIYLKNVNRSGYLPA